MLDTAAVILAGGLGKRMGGRNKALLAFDPQTTFIERQIRASEQWADEIIVVAGRDTSDLAGLYSDRADLRIVPDRYAQQGPLAGLQAGFAAATRPYVWLLACDQPQASAAAASLLLERLVQHEALAALPVLAGQPQPLHALYRNREVADIADDMLRHGERKLRALLERVHWIGVGEMEFERHGIAAGFADDVDTPEDYERLIGSVQAKHEERSGPD